MSAYSKFTYKWQNQPYKPWKGASRVEAVPGNARPITNGTWILNQPNGQPVLDGNAFLPRPIKHWRRQLQSDPIRGGSKPKNIREAFQPGATIYLGGEPGQNNECCDVSGKTGYKIIANISILKNNKFCSSAPCAYTVTAEDVENGWNGPIGKKICCNPVANVIKPATTILSKKYYTGTKAYLKSRCKLYEQKQTNNPIPGIQYYGADGGVLYPNNSPTGPQNFLTQNCANNCSSATQPTTIFKPSNRPFKTQGATESSNRTNKLRYDTVKTAASSLAADFGQSAANAGSYLLNYNTPYFVKSNYQKCTNYYYRKNGNHTKCFFTPTGNLNHTGQRITMITPRLYPQYSAQYPPVSTGPPGPSPPSPPLNVLATAGPNSGSVNISWSVPISDGGSPIISYTVTSSPGGIQFTTTSTSGLMTGLTNGTPYTFTVYATNAVGNSANSSASNSITPTNLPAPSVWFDPSDASKVTLSSGSVTALTDLTPNGYNGTYISPFVPATYVAPTYNVNPINGLSTFRIDNSGPTVQTICVPGYNFNDTFISYALVIRYISGTSGIIATDTPGLFGRGFGCDVSPVQGTLQTISYNAFTTWDGTPSPNITIPVNTPSILIASISAGNWIFSLNGTQYTLGLVQAKAPDNSNGLNIGCWNPSNSASIIFDCGEVLAYTSFLTSTQIEAVEGYLANKWGLTSILPPSHPYYSP